MLIHDEPDERPERYSGPLPKFEPRFEDAAGAVLCGMVIMLGLIIYAIFG